jgi:NAD-dependent SIR2 family protein deacetylase
MAFVPDAIKGGAPDLERLVDVGDLDRLIRAGGVVVLSGAGLSTESGIPDYRGASGTRLRRPAPMTYQAFVGDPLARRRYWARSHLGWGHIAEALPNAGHLAVARLEQRGLVIGTVTQNVDGLHSAAGSRSVVELHGRLDRVRCLGCGHLSRRADLDRRLSAANARWQARVTAINPDGDVSLPDEAVEDFVVVDCEQCGDVLKPDVVYFGEPVPRDRVEASFSLVNRASSLLVLGSSLTVYSGRRFVLAAASAGIPIAIVNDGPTRGDDLATVRISAPLGETLQRLA